MVFIKKLSLKNFRNLDHFDVELNKKIFIISGQNGSGKTNLLESISLLSPGRGLRGAKNEDICKIGADFWSINSIVESKIGISNLNIEYASSDNQKKLYFNNTKIRLKELINFTNALWLTPQMDGIFLDSNSERRKFLDRLTLIHFPNHGNLLLQNEKLQKERIAILLNNPLSYNWLDTIEHELAAISHTITSHRASVIEMINNSKIDIDYLFPKPTVKLLSNLTLMTVEEISLQFKHFRAQDKETERTHFGAHKADFECSFNGINAKLCSTGQQKALLINILISCNKLSVDSVPLLLLDEVFVHLDEIRSAALANFFSTAQSQIFITSTSRDITSFFKDSANVCDIEL